MPESLLDALGVGKGDKSNYRRSQAVQGFADCVGSDFYVTTIGLGAKPGTIDVIPAT